MASMINFQIRMDIYTRLLTSSTNPRMALGHVTVEKLTWILPIHRATWFCCRLCSSARLLKHEKFTTRCPNSTLGIGQCTFWPSVRFVTGELGGARQGRFCHQIFDPNKQNTFFAVDFYTIRDLQIGIFIYSRSSKLSWNIKNPFYSTQFITDKYFVLLQRIYFCTIH